MFEWMIALQGLGILLLVGVLTWLLSLVKRDVSIVDSVWSLFFLQERRPAYRAYRLRTNAFFPAPPKSLDKTRESSP